MQDDETLIQPILGIPEESSHTPLMSEDTKKTQLVSFYLTPLQHEKLRDIALTMGTRANDYARMLVLGKLNEVRGK